MMYSQSRKEDMELRLQILETIEMFIRIGDFEAAKEFGLRSKEVEERLRTKDYSGEDAVLTKINNVISL